MRATRVGRWWLIGLLCLAVWGTSGAVTGWAQEPSTDLARPAAETEPFIRDYEDLMPAVPAEPEPMGWRTGLGVVGSLGLVILVAYGSIWGMKRFLMSREGPGGTTALIRVRERVNLSPNRVLYLVEVGDRVLLLGGTDQQITTLADLEAEALEEGESFAERLAQATDGELTPVMAWRDNVETALEGLRSAIGRLRDLDRAEEL
ncbi:MAG: flagellar biosynthetic protein FliO [Chloroflexi bacterium]|nr:flagellar biosynthetic protein FliO [Chloroflexota bacterium]